MFLEPVDAILGLSGRSDEGGKSAKYKMSNIKRVKIYSLNRLNLFPAACVTFALVACSRVLDTLACLHLYTCLSENVKI